MNENRINRLEKVVKEQSDAIKDIASYVLDILHENDQLWKYIVENQKLNIESNNLYSKDSHLSSKGRVRCSEQSQGKVKFRSSTPPPLIEPLQSRNEYYSDKNSSGYTENPYLKLQSECESRRIAVERLAQTKMKIQSRYH